MTTDNKPKYGHCIMMDIKTENQLTNSSPSTDRRREKRSINYLGSRSGE